MELLRAFTGQLASSSSGDDCVPRPRPRKGSRRPTSSGPRCSRRCRHDLRTPLASIKAAATSLLQHDVEWTRDTEREFLETIDEEPTGSTTSSGNLLDMSRLQTGAVDLVLREVGFDEVVPAALHELGRRRGRADVVVDVPETLPPGQSRRRPARARGRKPRRQRVRTPSPPDRPYASSPAPCSTASSSASSTRARASRSTSASGCSSRSSGSGTSPTAPAWGSGSRSRGLRRGDGRRAHHRGHARRRDDDGGEPPGGGRFRLSVR